MNWTRNEHLIAGEWVTNAGHPTPVENPATLETVGTTAAGTGADAAVAIEAASAALPGWSLSSSEERQAALLDLAAQVRLRANELVAILVAELGTPERVARDIHVAATIADLEGFADALGKFSFETEIGNSLVVREALGVVACITPWNYPTHQIAAKVGGAIAAGCTVVLKPSEVTPLSAYLLGDALLASTVPAGVVNIVFGTGDTVGQTLVMSRDIDAISFTGSTTVGRSIAEIGARRMIPVALELGGKSASIVLDDADLETAVAWSVRSATVNSGQTCSACTRLIVPAKLADQVTELAREGAAALRVGDPQLDVDLGPLASRAQYDRVTGMLESARRTGAVVRQADLTTDLPGYFVPPAIVNGADPASAIAQEEVFGPVLVIQGAADTSEAVRLANFSPYGLGGAVWSSDPDRATLVARRLRTGQVDINGAAWNLQAPFGGTKSSGSGRELGIHGILEFTELKSIQR
ncbi:aldehyde dehydrogenase family protein [Rhodococcus globerulus]|uniref:aldehyde dehydrogenase family protein n=1 Tax=Rhodococcus globerulus TaxID=33008 RepID=UPI0005263EDD|nr:aldehyde dehydrogenase family protein [Rhodococcus globerulus]PVX59586.1 aldehyde dehydrogenase (NAD+) [Rhodococcus globerulus]